ncbi:hypothetical protein SAMN04489712_105326 [Thermomonospora echinospora]|uniref:Uncharacterized protein n=1 Tax=Thermomonospora echinospora TaxID=1992 RepID=A0A1H6ABJ9_9ACTN|nr:hypothetical protein [Thermomonospora echinospora]SEG45831.1 hypothetical protein SAMN04489712_105326 [Thermomonospora echinospora]
MSVALLLAEPGNDFPLNDDTVSPGLLGFAVFAALCVAVFLLIRSMNRQMRKIQAPRQADLDQEAWERNRAAEPAKAAEPAGTAKAGKAAGQADRDSGDDGRD